ncbi:MAG: class I SAM-dependent methyltransferase [Proteobacteria bacterium]|nr:class I SAM-dependent methyltransferase [Pseudomonadota bacterium]MBU1610855.1 class I SAM-dependent methyltransferase [Pseudomonadota bacterium]
MNPSSGARELMRTGAKIGCDLEESVAEPLALYLEVLVKYNRRMNLVGPANWRSIFETLVVDSIHLASFLQELALPVSPLTLDLGAGAGLPGIPLRMLWNAGEYWMVEVRQKRVSFMRTALGQLELERTNVFEGRAEEVLEHLADGGEPVLADLILSRAFMPWYKLLDYVPSMLTDSGRVIILSNDMPPHSGAFPDRWSLESFKAYPAAGGERYFWSVVPSV